VLAGLLNRKNLPSYSPRKVDESELRLVKEVVVSAFVDDPNEIVLGRSQIWYNPIDLAQDQRGFISNVLKTERELFP
jgi:hypothetical protein